MIITRTPYRMSFFGGGTDYPVWFREHGGAVLASTFDKYCYITCRYLPPFFQHTSRILYSRVEQVASNDKIEHPAARGALSFMNIKEGVEIHHDGDLPARTGVGSSSSFSVGLLHSLYALKGVMPSKLQLAKDAIELEQNILKENVGCQDQVLAAFGGLKRIDFLASGEICTTPVILSKERLGEFQGSLMLFFTGFARTASEIAKEQIDNTRNRTAELSLMYQMVDHAVSLLTGGGDLREFGALLHDSWCLKRGLSSRITTPVVDDIYAAARRAGAVGGKLMGAGGGGFMLFFAAPEVQPRIKDALRGLLQVPFAFEGQGSQVLLYEPEVLIQRDYPEPVPEKGLRCPVVLPPSSADLTAVVTPTTKN